MTALDWPGAWGAEVGGAAASAGDVDALRTPLPAIPARDLADAGARTGEPRRWFLRRRGILRLLVGRRFGRDPATVAIRYDARGAPRAGTDGPGGGGGVPFVSVSARGPLAAFALSDRPVGIDLEPLDDPGPIDAALSAREREALAHLPVQERALSALKLWTAKEACLKAAGTGLLRDPAGVEIHGDGDGGFGAASRPGRGAWCAPVLRGRPMVLAVYVGGDEEI